MFCVYILLNIHFSINNRLNKGKKVKVIYCFPWFWLDPDPYHLIRIRIPDPAIFYTDPDPGK